MKKPLVLVTLILVFVMGLLWLLSTRLAIALYRSDLDLKIASRLFSAESVLVSDGDLGSSGDPGNKRKYVLFFGKKRVIDALLSSDASARLTISDKKEWLRVFNLLSDPPRSVFLLESWMCDDLKWSILEAYYSDVDYAGASAASRKIESAYAYESALMSMIWGMTKSDKEKRMILDYWLEYVKKNKDIAVARYLLSALGRSGHSDLIRSKRSEILELAILLPPDSTEITTLRKRYSKELE